MGCSLMKTTAIDISADDIEFLTSNTRFTADEIKNWYKAFLADCPDGKLTKKKFSEIYQLFFPQGNPEHFCEQVFRTFDEDDSGWINFKEFLLAIGITTGNDAKAKLKWAFKMYDINKDGTIEFQEMGRIIKALYEMLGPEDSHTSGSKSSTNDDDTDDGPVDHARKVQFIFERIDKNHDGKVTLDEFITVCTEDPHLAKLLCAGATT